MITSGIYLMDGTGHYISSWGYPASKRIRRVSKRDLLGQECFLDIDSFDCHLCFLELTFKNYKTFPTVKGAKFELTHFVVIYLCRELLKIKIL